MTTSVCVRRSMPRLVTMPMRICCTAQLVSRGVDTRCALLHGEAGRTWCSRACPTSCVLQQKRMGCDMPYTLALPHIALLVGAWSAW